jgi:hypothetical protein
LLKKDDKEDDNSKKLYFMAYEISKEDENKREFTYENSLFWKYQPEVDFDMLKVQLQMGTQADDHRVLKRFLDMQSHLRLVKHLPEIIKFLNTIINNFYKSFYKHYASEKSIGDLLFSKNILAKSKSLSFAVFLFTISKTF